MVKTPLGRLSLEEQRTLIGEAPVVPRESRKTLKRNVAVGASVAVLAAGAVGAYVAMSDGKSVANVDTQSLEATQFVIPSEDDESTTGDEIAIPPFSDFDLNADGAISNDEYTAHLAVLRDNAIDHVQKSMLPAHLKEEYITRLHNNFVTESGCASRLANKDRKRNGLVTEERYDLFYSMIKEFCYVEDPIIPEEYRPTETPAPATTEEHKDDGEDVILTDTPEPSTTEEETYSPSTDEVPTMPPQPTEETYSPSTDEVPTMPPQPTDETESPSVEPTENPTPTPPNVVELAIPEGEAIKCQGESDAVFRYSGGERRWYPNPAIADSWDTEWSKAKFVDCSSLPRGDDMEFNQPKIPEGQAIKCHPADPAIYRFTDGHIRWYPNPPIAASWDPVWDRPIIIDCSRVPRGPDMPFKLPPPIGLPEGKAIKCDPNQPEVYRLVGGQRRWYPNPTIAFSWDKEWPNFAVVDCSSLPRGDDMALRLDGWTQLDGALVQISFDGKTLCGVNSAEDIWCATENIRGEGPTRWRQVPGKLTHVEVYGDSLWGVNRFNQIWYGSSVGDPRWVAIGGQLKMLSCDNKQLCGVNSKDEIWCADSNIRSNPNWRQVPGSLSYVEVVNGRLVGTNSNGDIFSGRSQGDPKWVQLGGSLRQLAFDGANLCGTNSVNDVWCADSGLLSSPNWSLVRGKMRHVTVNAGSVYAVDGNGGIYYRSL